MTLFRRARRISRNCWHWMRRGLVILEYHRVIDLEADPFLLAVSPGNFERHLEVLKKTAPVISLTDAARALRDGKLPRRAVVITFDDGYADNYQFALPLLRKHDLPATVFVATEHIDSGAEFWWYELERIFLRPNRLPATLRCTVDGRTIEWDLGNDAGYSVDQFHQHRSWFFGRGDFPTKRHELFERIWHYLHEMEPAPRTTVVAELIEQVRVPAQVDSPNRVMSSDEIRCLSRESKIDVGAHTVTHASLAKMSPAQQEEEILQSRKHLEEIVGRPVSTFSYPYGTSSDFTYETIRILREKHFQCACTNFAGLIRRSRDPFELPRFLVFNWDAETFAKRLTRWFKT